MGGRGTFAAGNEVEYQYETVGFIEGVKVLRRKDGKTGFPVEAHSSDAYIQLHPSGDFKMLREFDSDHYLVREIAFHPERGISGTKEDVLHIHIYNKDDFVNRDARPLTMNEINQYRKFFVGISDSYIEQYINKYIRGK